MFSAEENPPMSTLKMTRQGEGVRLALKVVPGARQERIVGVLGDALKMSVSQPPEGGAANNAVVRLLAAVLEVPLNHVQIVRGHTNPRKEVLIHGLDEQAIRQRLAEATGKSM
jgi:uncharacterized protein (TIGR00251 family)